MKVFVDTSAIYALLDRDDHNHFKAGQIWQRLLEKDDVLMTTNYVLIECFALLQNRLGIEAVRAFEESIVPLFHTEFVSQAVHRSGVSAVLTASRRKLSLVDCVSFEVMRAAGIRYAFAFDPHFNEHGLKIVH